MRALAITFLAIAAIPTTFAADKEVEDMLKVLRENYSRAKSVHMEVVSTMLVGEGEEIQLSSKAWFVGPSTFRIETKADTGTIISASDGKNGYNKGIDGKVVKGKFDPDDIASPVNLEVLCFWDWKRQLSTTKGNNMNESELRLLKKETWKDKDYMVLEEKAPKSKVFVRYYIDPVKKFIVRTAVYSLDNTAILLQDHKVTKFQLNAKVDAKLMKLPA